MKSPLSIHRGVMKDSHACLLHMCFFLSVHDVSFDQSSSMRMRGGVTLLLITLDLIVTGRANKLEENRGRRRHLQVPLEGPPHNSSLPGPRSSPGVGQTGGTVGAALSITANLYVSDCMFIACWMRSQRLLPSRVCTLTTV